MQTNFAEIKLDEKIIMGVLNLSKETFYNGSYVDTKEEALKKSEKMIENGAQIIDIGAMSTGPGVEPITEKEEKQLLAPVLEELSKNIDVPISIDTQRAEVAEMALKNGKTKIINDISGLKADEDMAKVLKEYDSEIIIMANGIEGRLRTAEKGRKDIQTIQDVIEALEKSLQICKDNDICLERISIDPGIGFGRGAKDDLKILANLEKLKKFNLPICLGVSRKSFIGKTLEIEKPAERLPGSLAATGFGILNSATDIIRTHDPEETSQFVRMLESIQKFEDV